MIIRVDEAVQRWSYMTTDYEPSESITDPSGWVQKDLVGTAEGVHQSLHGYGEEGWELVSVIPFAVGAKTKFKAIFKRPELREDTQAAPKEYKMNLGDLRMHLKTFSDDYEVIFGNGNLEFYRTKRRGDKLVQIEFSQMTDMIPDKP